MTLPVGRASPAAARAAQPDLLRSTPVTCSDALPHEVRKIRTIASTGLRPSYVQFLVLRIRILASYCLNARNMSPKVCTEGH